MALAQENARAELLQTPYQSLREFNMRSMPQRIMDILCALMANVIDIEHLCYWAVPGREIPAAASVNTRIQSLPLPLVGGVYV